jgi:hypothetical protein
MDGSPSNRLKMEKAAMIALAGPAAQRTHAPRSFRNYHASSDYRNAVDIAETVNGSTEQAQAWLKWVELRTRDDINELRPVVERLADELFRVETLEAGQIKTIITSTIAALVVPPMESLESLETCHRQSQTAPRRG